jgi:type I restriction enzyme S subunit
LRKSTLKKAFSGNLVDQDPNDQDASELMAYTKEAFDSYNEQIRRSNKLTPKIPKITYMPEMKSIIEILKSSNKAIPAEQLWQTSEYKDDIDEFYAALKKLMNEGKIQETARKGKESHIKLSDKK